MLTQKPIHFVRLAGTFTGCKVMISETSVYRIANGKLAEQWGFPDVMSLDNQLRAKK